MDSLQQVVHLLEHLLRRQQVGRGPEESDVQSALHWQEQFLLQSVGLAQLALDAVAFHGIAQLLGGFCGAGLVYIYYQDHYKASVSNPDGILGTFCTMPAIDHKSVNLLSEIIATCVLVFLILAIGTTGNTPAVGLGSIGAFPVTAIIMALGMSLGGTTGYAMNPARDLGPRCVHALIPLEGKRDSGWSYSWVPVVGPMVGCLLAAGLYLLVY